MRASTVAVQSFLLIGVVVSSLAFILTCMAATIPEPAPSNHSFETNDANIDPLLNTLTFEKFFRSTPLDTRKPGSRHTLSIPPTVPAERTSSNIPEAIPTTVPTIIPPLSGHDDQPDIEFHAGRRPGHRRADRRQRTARIDAGGRARMGRPGSSGPRRSGERPAERAEGGRGDRQHGSAPGPPQFACGRLDHLLPQGHLQDQWSDQYHQTRDALRRIGDGLQLSGRDSNTCSTSTRPGPPQQR